MNDTQETPAVAPDAPSAGNRWRRIFDTRRSSDDRVVAGVCAGLARRLDIDPVIVRVAFAVLTIVGLAGVILYLAAWFLLPEEGAASSVAADWFHLDKNEEQVRVAGLVGAGVLALVAVVGDGGWGWGWDGWPWILVPFAFLYYLLAVRPRRRRAEREVHLAATSVEAPVTKAERVRTATSRERRSGALTMLTLSIAAIAVAVTRFVTEIADEDVSWTIYLAIALGVVALGLLLGTVVGHGGPLIGIGILLTIALTIGSVLPSTRIGEQDVRPSTATAVDARYEHGIGQFELDLTSVVDADDLLGRTVEVAVGIGQTRVIVPRGLNVEVDTRLRAGQVDVLGRMADGTDNRLDVEAGAGPFLTIEIDNGLGHVEVIRR